MIDVSRVKDKGIQMLSAALSESGLIRASKPLRVTLKNITCNDGKDNV